MLNTYNAQSIASTIEELLSSEGYDDPQEIIPGLVLALLSYAKRTEDTEGTLDSAVELLDTYLDE